MKQEEIVQFVGPDGIFGRLHDVLIGAQGEQFRGDRRLNDIDENLADGILDEILRHVANQKFHEGFGDRTVDVVHRHVVGVVSAPAESLFGHIASPKHESSIHQEHGPHSSLYVFKHQIAALVLG